MDEAERQRRDEMIEASMEDTDLEGKPFKRTAAEGIRVMQERIEYIRRRIQALHDSTRATGVQDTELLLSMQRDLADAGLKLAEYQRLHEGRN